MVEGEKVRIIIDSGTIGNFISKRLLQELGITDYKKTKPYELIVINGSGLPS